MIWLGETKKSGAKCSAQTPSLILTVVPFSVSVGCPAAAFAEEESSSPKAETSDSGATAPSRKLAEDTFAKLMVEPKLGNRKEFDERVIGPELHGALQRDLSAARSVVDARPALDLGLETRTLLTRVPLFANLDREHLDAVVRLLRPRLVIPSERLISVGEPGDAA